VKSSCRIRHPEQRLSNVYSRVTCPAAIASALRQRCVLQTLVDALICKGLVLLHAPLRRWWASSMMTGQIGAGSFLEAKLLWRLDWFPWYDLASRWNRYDDLSIAEALPTRSVSEIICRSDRHPRRDITRQSADLIFPLRSATCGFGR
jgi:hypothetical protein